VVKVYLVSLALQVDVFLVSLHLHLLHFTLQLAVRLLQAVVVSESKEHQMITWLLQLPVTQHLPSVFRTTDTLTLTTTGKVIWVGSLLGSYHQVSDGPLSLRWEIHSYTFIFVESYKVIILYAGAHLSSPCSLSSSSWMRVFSLETSESWLVLCDPSR